MIPETLRLADYGLGHEERAQHPQPVAGRLGPRFYDWQLAQSPEESWRECHLHARNLLGADGYRRLLDETVVERQQDEVAQQPQLKSNRQLLQAADSQGEYILNDSARVSQGTLFE